MLNKSNIDKLIQEIFALEEIKQSETLHQKFEQLALKIFQFQKENNSIYKEFIELSNSIEPTCLEEIPFLPISFFKSHELLSTSKTGNETLFLSSGTTGSERSKHLVTSTKIYETSFYKTYERQIGNPKNQVILALLPNYLEQGNSSLVYMVNDLINQSNHELSGFYLNQYDIIYEKYLQALSENKNVVIFGVSYALLDLAEKGFDFSEAIIIETGGMKGRRKEISKNELHQIIQKGSKAKLISSEYGMTELLSQAYCDNNRIFAPAPWMKILIRDVNDPKQILNKEKIGGINVIDLANIYSCSFIATQDLGRIEKNGFSLHGRFDNAEIRGCNLLLS